MTAVTPIAAINSMVITGGTALVAFNGAPKGGIITNPATPEDQGIGDAEVLYVNPVGAATLNANGTTFALYPGQSWEVIPEQSTTTSVNAATSGHKFSAVSW